jgi:hypothetical protein
LKKRENQVSPSPSNSDTPRITNSKPKTTELYEGAANIDKPVYGIEIAALVKNFRISKIKIANAFVTETYRFNGN